MTTQGQVPARPPRRKISLVLVLVCMTVVVLGLLGVFVWLTDLHKDGSIVLTVLGSVLGSGIAGVASLGKTQELGNQVSVVQHQTNGNMSRMLDIVEQTMANQVSATMNAHATAQHAITAVTTVAESPSVPAAAPLAPAAPADVSPPPTVGGAQPGSEQ